MQLAPLTKRNVKNVPYEIDTDHGVTYKYYKARPSVASHIPVPSNKLDMMSVNIGQSPKLRAFLAQVYEWKQQGERILAFFNWPMCQWDAERLLYMMGLKVLSLASFHTTEERRKILAKFNDKDSDVDILLVGLRNRSYGLNFHECCSKIIIMEYPTSIDILLQVFGRLHRFGQTKPQEIVIFFLEGSFDKFVCANMAKKFISKLAAEGEFRHVDDENLLVEAMKVLHRLLGEAIIDSHDPDLREAIAKVRSDEDVPAEEMRYDDHDDDADFEEEDLEGSFEEEDSD
ncbi:Helicase C-terminal protein [Rutstroemia sp. NJR-2017a BBW]|nr:Helicase C-terminal protein [Rutstroemia sp. NJR-2017a BBW]